MASRGRHTKYTPETVGKILEAIKAGGSDKDACAYSGIDDKTFYRWLHEHSEFREQVTYTRTRGKIAIIGSILKAGEKDWRARAWYAERRWPEEYAQQLIVKITPEQAQVLKKAGVSAGDVMEMAIQEIAAAQSEVKA